MGILTVGIAGGTGSGKTTIARSIGAALPPEAVSVIEHDSYYRHRPDLSYDERCNLNFDHPDALETELLIEHLKSLKRGEAVEVPEYDFTSHERKVETRTVEPTPLLIVEGILVFVDPILRSLFDIKIFVDTDPDIRVIRRIRRDIEQRGRSFASIREQYYKSVRPMHLQFVEPSKRWADLIVPEGGGNSVAIDVLAVKLMSVIGENPGRS